MDNVVCLKLFLIETYYFFHPKGRGEKLLWRLTVSEFVLETNCTLQVWKKVVYVDRLLQLFRYVPREQLTIPDFVFQWVFPFLVPQWFYFTFYVLHAILFSVDSPNDQSRNNENWFQNCYNTFDAGMIWKWMGERVLLWTLEQNMYINDRRNHTKQFTTRGWSSDFSFVIIFVVLSRGRGLYVGVYSCTISVLFIYFFIKYVEQWSLSVPDGNKLVPFCIILDNSQNNNWRWFELCL